MISSRTAIRLTLERTRRDKDVGVSISATRRSTWALGGMIRPVAVVMLLATPLLAGESVSTGSTTSAIRGLARFSTG